MKNQMIMPAVIALVVGGGVGFFGGMQYQESKQPAFSQFGARSGASGGRQGTNGQLNQGNRVGIRPVTGSILSVDNGTMTVKLDDGSSKIIALPDSAVIEKSTAGTRTDLTVGTTVGVIGQQNSDGTVTAQTIQLNPIRRTNPASSAQPGK